MIRGLEMNKLFKAFNELFIFENYEEFNEPILYTEILDNFQK